MSELLDELSAAHLEYPLRNGTVGDWLVLGPLMTPLSDPLNVQSKVARQLVLNTIFVDADEVIPTPAERANREVTVGDGVTLQGMWRVVNTLEDGWVDGAQHVETPHSLCAWTYAQVVLPAPIETTLRLTAASPTQVWINGEAVFSTNELPDQPTPLDFGAALDGGTNEVLIRVANVGIGDVPMVVGLHIEGAEGVVKLPTLLEPVARRQKLAAVMAHAYLTQDVYSRKERIVVHWPDDLPMIDALTVRLQTPASRIRGEANPMIQKGAQSDLGEARLLPNGPYEILLQPQFEEYYVQNMRVQRRLPLRVCNGEWSEIYYDTHAERRIQALEDAAQRAGDIWAEVAHSALGQWDNLRHEVIEQTLIQISQRAWGYEAAMLAMLGWVARMGDLPDFPQEAAWALEERVPLILEQVDEQLEAGSNALLAACHLLAGQLYPQRSFGDLKMGETHQAEAEAWLLRWMRATAQMGLPAGESERSYATTLVVLSHLVDLAHADEVAEMAAATLDKVAFQMAQQCFLGAWGGSQDDGDAAWLLNARLGPLGGVACLWWGQGAFNAECGATVALACAESYMLPEIIAAIGLDRQQDNWLRRQDAIVLAKDIADGNGTADGHNDAEQRVNRAAFRTGDYLLASAQGDWAADTSGVRWKVTLGPDATIFGNQPACSSEHAAWTQSYWGGNAAPVRVAQWRDVLAVAYGPSGAHGLDFSHAYFPRAAFDDVFMGNGWVMARRGNGYVALTAAGGIEAVTTGRTAYRELRAAAQSVWLVQMGRAAEDGTFAQFVEKVQAQPLALTAAQVTFTTLRGHAVRLDGDASLEQAWWVDDVAQPLTDFPHVESIYGGAAALPAPSVEIRYQEHLMQVDFALPDLPSNLSPDLS